MHAWTELLFACRHESDLLLLAACRHESDLLFDLNDEVNVFVDNAAEV